MTSSATKVTYQFNGSAALAVQDRRLVLVEGGLGEAAPRPCKPAQRRLSPSQTRLALVAATLLVLAAVAASALSDSLAASARARVLDSAPTSSVTVAAGDSLWSIAGGCGVEGVPTQDVVAWIKEVNALQGGVIAPGQTLVVPCAKS